VTHRRNNNSDTPEGVLLQTPLHTQGEAIPSDATLLLKVTYASSRACDTLEHNSRSFRLADLFEGTALLGEARQSLTYVAPSDGKAPSSKSTPRVVSS